MCNDAQHSHFSQHIRNIVKKARDNMGWVLRGFQSRKSFLILTLLSVLREPIVIPLLIRVLLSSLQFMESKRHTSYRSYSTNVHIQKHFKYLQHLNYWERLHKLKLNSLQRRRERYVIIKHKTKRYMIIKQHMVPNIGSTDEHKIKNKKHR